MARSSDELDRMKARMAYAREVAAQNKAVRHGLVPQEPSTTLTEPDGDAVDDEAPFTGPPLSPNPPAMAGAAVQTVSDARVLPVLSPAVDGAMPVPMPHDIARLFASRQTSRGIPVRALMDFLGTFACERAEQGGLPRSAAGPGVLARAEGETPDSLPMTAGVFLRLSDVARRSGLTPTTLVLDAWSVLRRTTDALRANSSPLAMRHLAMALNLRRGQ